MHVLPELPSRISNLHICPFIPALQNLFTSINLINRKSVLLKLDNSSNTWVSSPSINSLLLCLYKPNSLSTLMITKATCSIFMVVIKVILMWSIQREEASFSHSIQVVQALQFICAISCCSLNFPKSLGFFEGKYL